VSCTESLSSLDDNENDTRVQLISCASPKANGTSDALAPLFAFGDASAHDIRKSLKQVAFSSASVFACTFFACAALLLFAFGESLRRKPSAKAFGESLRRKPSAKAFGEGLLRYPRETSDERNER
jgi:hypothetical protein